MKYLIILLPILIFVGCSSSTNPLNDSDNYFGQLINKSTNVPLNNISINLCRFLIKGGHEILTSYDTLYTNSNGIFSFDKSYIKKGDFIYKIWINLSPNNVNYDVKNYSINSNNIDLGKFFIYEFTNIKVKVEQKSDIVNCNIYQISLPRYTNTFWAGKDTFFSGLAFGNTYNKIKLECVVENEDLFLSDSVFCPLNKETIYKIEY